ncbi:MAG: formylglycine-generating enzyme family protein [Bacteroidota bacterium]
MFRYTIAAITCSICVTLTGQTDPEPAPDGMTLIPGGTFLMGTSSSQQPIATPAHRVKLNSFYMDTREVSNKAYYEFCMATGHRLPEFWGMELYKSGTAFPDHPVVGVSQFDACEFAEWAGKRLPTEAEWEYAARGGLEGFDFPFGEKAIRSKARYNDPEAEKGPVPTGSYEPNGYGLYDMSGNVWEWVSDWFQAGYYSESPEENPRGPGWGTFRVFRGGGWHSGAGCSSVYNRNALPQHWVDMAGGFRCVKDVE